jgi:hypothetical protein
LIHHFTLLASAKKGPHCEREEGLYKRHRLQGFGALRYRNVSSVTLLA